MITKATRSMKLPQLNRVVGRRFNSHSSGGAESFTNKFNFNTNPPPIHTYWSMRNGFILVALVPFYLGVTYFFKYAGTSLSGLEGLINFADSEKTPMKSIQFGESQTPEK